MILFFEPNVLRNLLLLLRLRATRDVTFVALLLLAWCALIGNGYERRRANSVRSSMTNPAIVSGSHIDLARYTESVDAWPHDLNGSVVRRHVVFFYQHSCSYCRTNLPNWEALLDRAVASRYGSVDR